MFLFYQMYRYYLPKKLTKPSKIGIKPKKHPPLAASLSTRLARGLYRRLERISVSLLPIGCFALYTVNPSSARTTFSLPRYARARQFDSGRRSERISRLRSISQYMYTVHGINTHIKIVSTINEGSSRTWQ